MVDRMDQIPVMGDKDQSSASFTTCAREKRGDFTCILIIEVTDRLIGKNERGIVDESPGNRDALLLTAAQFRGPVPGAIAKPNPAPLARTPLPRQKRLKMCGRSSTGMPGPLSWTLIAPSGPTSTITSVPGAVCARAFSMRLRSASAIAAALPVTRTG